MTEHEKEKLFAAIARIEERLVRLVRVEAELPARTRVLYSNCPGFEGLELMPSRLVESLPDEEGPRWVSRSRRA